MRFASSVCKNWEDISNTARQHQRMANAVVPMAEGLRVDKTGSSGTRADQRAASRKIGFKSTSAQVSLRYSKSSLSSVWSSSAQRCAVNNPRRGISKCQGSDKTRITRDRAALQAALPLFSMNSPTSTSFLSSFLVTFISSNHNGCQGSAELPAPRGAGEG